MTIKIGIADDFLPLIQGRIESGRWWIIPACTTDSFDIATLIEERFYASPKRARQFDVFSVPWLSPDVPLLSLFLAHKRWMSGSQLTSLTGISIESRGGQESDLLLSVDLPRSVLAWLQDTFRWGGVPNSN